MEPTEKVDRKKFPFEMRTHEPGEKTYYSELQVLHSAAGYYIGRMGWVVDEKLGSYPEPYSRESEYYRTEEAAQKALDSDKFGRVSGVENLYAKQEGNLP